MEQMMVVVDKIELSSGGGVTRRCVPEYSGMHQVWQPWQTHSLISRAPRIYNTFQLEILPVIRVFFVGYFRRTTLD